MLHIAIKIPDEGWNYQAMASSITNWGHPSSAVADGTPITHPDNLLADVTLSALKERIKARIHRNPDERWLLLSGNTIAESAAPPVSFRQW